MTAIWAATDRGPATGTMRFPVDTGAASTPGYLTVAEMATFAWESPTLVTPNLGVATATSLATGAVTVTSTSASALAVGANGATNPVFSVNANTASVATGVAVTGAAAGARVDIAAISSGTDEGINLSSKGTGSVAIRTGTSSRLVISANAATFTPTTVTSAATVRFSYTGAANTGLTAGTEFTQVHFNLGQTNQHASNTNITTQRDVIFTPMNDSFASATGTITNKYGFWFNVATAGTNAVYTNNYSFGTAGNAFFTGKQVFDTTITGGGTTGDQVINKPTGTVNFATAATAITVTNAFCTTSSTVFAVVRTNDSTATIKNVVPGSGSFVITLGAAASAETSVGFLVIN